jgi:hypothetical protein
VAEAFDRDADRSVVDTPQRLRDAVAALDLRLPPVAITKLEQPNTAGQLRW